MANENVTDIYGEEYKKHTDYKCPSQMSSIAKYGYSLNELFAEALNLHMMYKDAVLGEVYLIPVYEYDEATMNEKKNYI